MVGLLKGEGQGDKEGRGGEGRQRVASYRNRFVWLLGRFEGLLAPRTTYRAAICMYTHTLAHTHVHIYVHIYPQIGFRRLRSSQQQRRLNQTQ